MTLVACGDSSSEPKPEPDDQQEPDDNTPGGSTMRDAGRSIDAGPSKGGNSDAGARDGGSKPVVNADGGIVSEGKGGGCTGNLLPLPDDMKARGPWDVGVKTLKIGRLTVEAFYPAEPGSTAGKEEARYDIRDWLPMREQKKVPDENVPLITAVGGHLYRDVPLDTKHGPYPVVIFIHGTASFRIASGTTTTHWASRGMIVLAADYPGLGLSDQLSATLECGLPTSGAQDLPGDVNLQLAALKTPAGDTEFFGKNADLTRIGISGHSQGGCVSATLSTVPGVKVVLPLDGSTAVTASEELKSIMYVAGMNDTVIGYSFPLIGNVVCPIGSATTTAAYQFSPGPPKVKKRLVGITGGGHLVPTDLCQTNKFGKNAIQEANAFGVCGINSAVIIGLPALFDCGTIDWQKGLEAVNYATTAALEEALLCQDRSKQFADLKTSLPQVGDFQETVK